jgi:hypothetical protein
MTEHVVSAPIALATPKKPANPPSHKIMSVCTLSSGTKDFTEIGVAWPTKKGGFFLRFKQALPAAGADILLVVNKPYGA